MNPEDAIGENVIFWAMQYHNLDRHRPFTFKKTPPQDSFSVREFTAAHGKIPADRFDMVKAHSQWLPGTQTIDSKQATYHIPNASKRKFELILDFDENIADGQPLSITMELLEDVKIGSMDLEILELTQKHSTLTMTFRD